LPIQRKKPEGKFATIILSPIAEVVGYYSMKKDTIGKSEKTVEKWERNSKGKNAEAKEEVCSSN